MHQQGQRFVGGENQLALGRIARGKPQGGKVTSLEKADLRFCGRGSARGNHDTSRKEQKLPNFPVWHRSGQGITGMCKPAFNGALREPRG